jgi:hypothetical protein
MSGSCCKYSIMKASNLSHGCPNVKSKASSVIVIYHSWSKSVEGHNRRAASDRPCESEICDLVEPLRGLEMVG